MIFVSVYSWVRKYNVLAGKHKYQNLPEDLILINVQGDEPLIDINSVNKLADFVRSNGRAMRMRFSEWLDPSGALVGGALLQQLSDYRKTKIGTARCYNLKNCSSLFSLFPGNLF